MTEVPLNFFLKFCRLEFCSVFLSALRVKISLKWDIYALANSIHPDSTAPVGLDGRY